MLTPANAPEAEASAAFDMWALFSKAMTCCFPPFCLNACHIKGKGPQQAWREKVTLCWIAILMSAFVMFFVVGLNPLLCPTNNKQEPVPMTAVGGIIVHGIMYDVRRASDDIKARFPDARGQDVSAAFVQEQIPVCQNLDATAYPFAFVQSECEFAGNCLSTTGLPPFNRLDGGETVDPTATYDWDEIKAQGLVVLRDSVLNLDPYFKSGVATAPLPNNPVDHLLRQLRNMTDATRSVYSLPAFGTNKAAIDCLEQKFFAGRVSMQTSSCILSFLFSTMVAIIVLGVLGARFVMAVVFDWFLSYRLARTPDIASYPSTSQEYMKRSNDTELTHIADRKVKPAPFDRKEIGLDLYTILLITCYSEGEESLRCTMESMAATDYTDSRKLLFVIADGLITGKGNPKSTPDLLLDMIEIDHTFGMNPKPYSYIAVASGSKQHNMARVYVGHFSKY